MFGSKEEEEKSKDVVFCGAIASATAPLITDTVSKIFWQRLKKGKRRGRKRM